MADDLVRLSKFLSLVLRHDPGTIGLSLDGGGWAQIDQLIERAKTNGKALDRALIHRIVADNDKQRFAISSDGSRIRASQGHSLKVELELLPATPPDRLYHGTAARFLEAIRAEGLNRRSRNHVHLSPDTMTAVDVGKRHGKPLVLTINAAAMKAAGHEFYKSANGVWLTAEVPAAFIDFPST